MKVYTSMKNGKYTVDFTEGEKLTINFSRAEKFTDKKAVVLAAREYGRKYGKGYKVI